MKFIQTIFIVFLCAILPTNAQADGDYNIRVLSHFGKNVKNNFGVSGWLIQPNVVEDPNKHIFIIGPSWDDGKAWVEVMGGGLFNRTTDEDNNLVTKLVPVFSTRFQMTPKFWMEKIKVPLNVWGNFQLINVGDNDNMITYAFLMTNYLIKPFGLVGVETENYFNRGPADGKDNFLAVGPQVVIPYKGLNVIMAYQFHLHENEDDQVWVRTMFNFK